MAALICIKNVRGTFCQLVNIANRFLRIFSNIEASIRFIFPGGAGYPYLPTRLFRDNRAVAIKWQCCIMGLISVVIGTLHDFTALRVGTHHPASR